MAPENGVLDAKRLSALAEELRKRPAPARVVDQLKKVEAELRRLRGESRGYNEIWDICKGAGLRCSYAHFVKALRSVLESNVTPLEQARARSKSRKPGIPRAPLSLEATRSGDAAERSGSERAPARRGSGGDARSRLIGVSALDVEAARVNRPH